MRTTSSALFALFFAAAAAPALAQATITSVTPPAGLTTGGTQITIKGSGFSVINPCPILCFPPMLLFRRGNTDVPVPYTLVNDTTITAVTPPLPAGPVDVVFLNYGFGPPANPFPNGFFYVESVPALKPAALAALLLALAAISWVALRR